jgi:tetratricopeptide (TPR) repeat protein
MSSCFSRMLPLLLWMAVLAVPSSGWAGDNSKNSAEQHRKKAAHFYDVGRWDEAIAEYEQAYALHADSILLFDMAQTFGRKGDSKRALDLYENYLIKDPAGPMRSEVEARIKALKAEQGQPPASAVAAPEAASPEEVQRQEETRRQKEAQRQEEATHHIEKGQANVNLGRWDDAVAEYEAAYAINQDPTLLYNVADTFRRKGDDKRAIDLYQTFLHKAPDSSFRPIAETWIGILDKQLKNAPPTQPASLATTPLVPEPIPSPQEGSVSSPFAPARSAESQESHTGQRVGGILLMVGGVGSLAAGGYYSWRTKNIEHSINQATVYNSNQYSSGKSAQTMQWVCYGIGAGATVLGLILSLTAGSDSREHETRISLVPQVSPNSTGFAAQGVF